MMDREPVAELSFGSTDRLLDLFAVADEDDLYLRILRDGLDGTGHDRPGGVVAPHRVQRDPHGLLLLGFQSHDFTALIEATVRANAMRQDRLVALRAILNLDGFLVVVAPSAPLPGMRRAALRNSHECSPCSGAAI